ncbi:MAG: hypothetical protein ACK47C_05390 [Paracoccaceae bacterium]
MTKAIPLAGLFLALSVPVLADTVACRSGCGTSYLLTSASETRSYGILIAAPDAGCRHVRFRVEDATATYLGRTPTMEPGELAVVRMGKGFAKGDHFLMIGAEGCDVRPAATRRVTLAKQSPDHGWRSQPD